MSQWVLWITTATWTMTTHQPGTKVTLCINPSQRTVNPWLEKQWSWDWLSVSPSSSSSCFWGQFHYSRKSFISPEIYCQRLAMCWQSCVDVGLKKSCRLIRNLPGPIYQIKQETIKCYQTLRLRPVFFTSIRRLQRQQQVGFTSGKLEIILRWQGNIIQVHFKSTILPEI